MRSLVLFIVLLFVNVVGFSQITINLPLSRSVFQRDNNNASTISISGIYENELERIEARLVPVKEGQGTPTNWEVIVNKPQFGSFTGVIKGIGGWYQLQLRGWKGGVVVAQASVDKVGIGEVFLIAGQSNAEGKRNFGEKASVDDRVNCFDYQKIDFLDEIPPFQSFSHIERTSSIAPRGQGAWCWGELGDLLTKRLNVPIMFFNAAYEGTSIENWYSSSIGVATKHPFFQFTFPRGTPYSYLRISLQYYISQLGLRSVLWEQGEAESELRTTKDYYAMALKMIIEKSRVDTGKKINWMVSRTSLFNTNQTYSTVINAQNSVINPADFIFEGPFTDSIQVPRPEGVHFTDSGISDLAKAWNTKMTTRFFAQSTPVLPSPIVSLNAACQVSDRVTLSLPSIYSIQKWSNNTTNASVTASNGVFSSIARDRIGNYYFTSTIDVKKVFPTTRPFVYAKTNPQFCEGTSTDILTDSPDYKSFIWNTGDTQKQITVNKSGFYSARGISDLGCISPESNVIEAQSIAPPGKPVIYQSDVIACEGSSITLASTSLKESVWSTNNVGSVITLTAVGDYRVTVKAKDENGCLSVNSDPVSFSIKPRPETPEITQVGIFTLQANQKTEMNDLTYQWNQDGVITTSSSNTLKVNRASFFTVKSMRKYSGGNKIITCSSNQSGAYSFVPDPLSTGIITYPNPTPDGLLTLEAKDNIQDLVLSVYTLNGQLIYTTTVPTLSERRSIDLSNLASGRYLVKLIHGEFTETKSISIHK